jgi:serine/threonine protein phosphatase PrpC
VPTVGVSAEPEMTECDVSDQDEFIIMCTDGVWDVIDNNQAVELVQSYIQKDGKGGSNWDAEEAASLIARSARRRWTQLSSMIDDITCLVIKLH